MLDRLGQELDLLRGQLAAVRAAHGLNDEPDDDDEPVEGGAPCSQTTRALRDRRRSTDGYGATGPSKPDHVWRQPIPRSTATTTTPNGAGRCATRPPCSSGSAWRRSKRAVVADHPAQAGELPAGLRRVRHRAHRPLHRTDVARLMADTGIVRNRAKIEATIANARAAADLDVDLGELLWSFAPPPRPRPADLSQVPAVSPESQGDGQGIEAARLPVRRPDNRLRADAGDRNGRRPHRVLLGSVGRIDRRTQGLSHGSLHTDARIGNNRGSSVAVRCRVLSTGGQSRLRRVRPTWRAGSCGGSTRWRR